MRIIAAGNMLHLPVPLRNQLQASGVSLHHVETRGRKDATDKALITELCLLAAEHPPPYGIALMSGDADFAYSLARMRNLGYFTVVVAGSRGKVCAALLKGVGNIVWGLREDVLQTMGSAADGSAPDGVEMERLKKRVDELEAELKVTCAPQSGKESPGASVIEAVIQRRKQQPPTRRLDAGGTSGAKEVGGRWERCQVRMREVARGIVAEDADPDRLSRLLSQRRGLLAPLMMLGGLIILYAGFSVMRKKLLNGMQFGFWVTEARSVLGGLLLLGFVVILVHGVNAQRE